ncbi:MAG: hypothetical protein GDA43_04130 [Hormoscilla sp. SP5CHS1]|nr:hypothetical protein [Hormoscilla sp. SP5CHS1]
MLPSPSLEDWEEIVDRWQQAINLLKQVSDNHPQYEEVRDKKIPEYMENLNRVESQVPKASQN